VICLLADSYVKPCQEAGSTVELAGLRNIPPYGPSMISSQVAIETLGPLNETACKFLNISDQKIGDNTGNNRSTSFLFQRISVLVQRFNAVLLKDSFMWDRIPSFLFFLMQISFL